MRTMKIEDHILIFVKKKKKTEGKLKKLEPKKEKRKEKHNLRNRMTGNSMAVPLPLELSVFTSLF